MVTVSDPDKARQLIADAEHAAQSIAWPPRKVEALIRIAEIGLTTEPVRALSSSGTTPTRASPG